MVVALLGACSIAAVNYLLVQLAHSALVFVFIYPIAYGLRTVFPAVASGLCWLVVLRLIVPVDLSDAWSILTLFNGLEVYPLPVIDDLLAFPLVDAVSVSHVLAPQYGIRHVFLFLLLVTCFAISGYNMRAHYLRRKRFSTLAHEGVELENAGLESVGLERTELLRHLAAWKKYFGIRRTIRVVISAKATFVYTIGSCRPIIVFPEGFVNDAGSTCIESVVAHELAHIKRFDDMAITALGFIRGLFFFFPPLLLCIREIAKNREKLCDREVLSRQKIGAFDYAHSLVVVVEKLSQVKFSDAVAQASGVGVLKERIAYLKQKNSRRKIYPLRSSALFAVLSFLVLPLASHSHIESRAVAAVSFERPVRNARVSSVYGPRTMPLGPERGKQILHRGVDFAGDAGTAIYAASRGVVIAAIEDYKNSAVPAYGKTLVIEHDNGLQTRYMHLQSLLVELGARVADGEQIALMGSSGLATGPHLHFEILRDNQQVDPSSYIEVVLGQ